MNQSQNGNRLNCCETIKKIKKHKKHSIMNKSRVNHGWWNKLHANSFL